jgi:hypothetical protein
MERRCIGHYLGPDFYSFSYGGIHFIGLNSVDYNDLWYYGNIDSLQLDWIKRDVSGIDKSTPIVTFNHIPFFSGGLSLMEYSEEEPGSFLISINGKKTISACRHQCSCCSRNNETSQLPCRSRRSLPLFAKIHF